MIRFEAQLEQLIRNEKTPVITTLVVALLFAYSAWQTVTTFTTQTITPSQQTTTVPTQAMQSISNLHLFGIYAGNLSDLPSTQLPFTLEGTVLIANAPDTSRALISSDGGLAKVYQTGDFLPNHVAIIRIAKHYVVINDNDTLEKISLPIESLTPAGD